MKHHARRARLRAEQTLAAAEAGGEAASDPICPLCDRPIPPGVRSNLHHLTPVLRGGAQGPTVRLHLICHKEIHSVLTETDLARRYNSIEALRRHPAIARFVQWVSTKPPSLNKRTVGNHRKRRRV